MMVKLAVATTDGGKRTLDPGAAHISITCEYIHSDRQHVAEQTITCPMMGFDVKKEWWEHTDSLLPGNIALDILPRLPVQKCRVKQTHHFRLEHEKIVELFVIR